MDVVYLINKIVGSRDFPCVRYDNRRLSRFLTDLGTMPVHQGPGDQHQGQEVQMLHKKLVLAIDIDCTEPTVPQRIREVVLHEIRKDEAGVDRFGMVTLHMWDGDRIKCDWSENADGTVEVSR